MLTLAELCKAIDKFYILSAADYSLYKRAELTVKSPAYDKVTEDNGIYDTISNSDFAELFDDYLKTYENLVNSLQISPQEFAKIISGGETQDDNFADFLSPFEEAYNALVESPYLQQDIQSEDWEEGFTPQEVTASIESLAKDAWDRIFALGKAVGLSQSAVRGALEERSNIFENEVQGRSEQAGVGADREGAGTGMTTQEQEFRNRKIHKAQEYAQTHRRRRREGLAVGEDGLKSQIQELNDAIVKETNGIKREELVKRLKEKLDRLKLVTTYRNQQAKQLAKLKAPENEDKYNKYVEENNARKINNHAYNFKFWGLINALRNSQSPNDRARIKAEIVRLKKDLLQRASPKLDFDSPEVMYNTKIQEQLNPNNIIDSYERRRGQRKKHWQSHHEKFKKNRTKGNLEGLLTEFNRSIAYDKSDIKKRVNRALEKSPAVKPYVDALAAAKKAKDDSAMKAAALAYSNFLDSSDYAAIRDAHPDYQAVMKTEDAMREWRSRVKDIQTSKVLEMETIDETTLAKIRRIIDIGKALIAAYTRNASLNKQMNDIVTLLEDSISSITSGTSP